MKRILFLISIIACSLSLHAQFTSAITTTIKAKYLPTNANVPVVAELSSPNSQAFLFDLDAETYDNANDSTAFAALLTAIKAELDTNYIVPVFGIDTTLDVTARYVVTDIDRTWDNFTKNDKKNQYKAASDVFRVRGRAQWVKEPD